MSPYLAAEDLSMFGRDPWWLVVVKAVFCFAFLMLTVLFLAMILGVAMLDKPAPQGGGGGGGGH